MNTTRPVALEFEPRFCANHVVDLTAGCSFGCVYCPFADIAARREEVAAPTAYDTAGIGTIVAPRSVFLSPASDPFAPQAARATHALLAHLLPQGTIVGILTKGVIPPETFDLLARYPAQVEGVGVGLTSMDDERNRILEPGCPPAARRLANIAAAASRGLPSAVRMDPIFPELDDAPTQLDEVVRAAASHGALGVMGTYVFAWGRYLRRLRNLPLTAVSAAHLIDRAPMEGGVAFSVPLARKLATYALLNDLCRAQGMRFKTCGCKDVRVRMNGTIDAVCRNDAFLEDRGEANSCLTPPATRPAPTA